MNRSEQLSTAVSSRPGPARRRAKPTEDSFTSLTRDYYVSSACLERELDSIFFRHWLYAGHESELGRPGDFVTREVGDESIIVTRGEDGGLHALFNVCRHRGTRICDEASGSAKRLVCPYHQWTYGLDGRLIRAPGMPAGFDRSDYPLRPAHVDSWNGLVFVNLSEDEPEPLGELLEPARSALEPFGVGGCKVAHTIVYGVEANWKLVIENFVECYHCGGTHPEFCRTFDLKEFFSTISSYTDPFERPHALVHYGSLPLKAGMQSLTITGDRVCKRLLGTCSEEDGAKNAGVTLRPTTSALAFPDYGIVFDIQPVSTARTRVRCQWFVAGTAREGRDYDVPTLIELWDVTNRQDWQLCERAQRGVLSRRYVPGPISSAREPGIREFLESYLAMLGENGG